MKGIKYDEGKRQWHLLVNKHTIKAIEEVIKVLEYGAKKYPPHNWVHVAEEDTENTRYFNASFRHATAFEKYDKESGLHHLAHKICCDLFQLSKELNKNCQHVVSKPNNKQKVK